MSVISEGTMEGRGECGKMTVCKKSFVTVRFIGNLRNQACQINEIILSGLFYFVCMDGWRF